jgi:SAM-dependent methyltransferase
VTPDDRQRLSSIAHTGSPMWGPIADGTLEEVVARVGELGAGGESRTVDLGCGPAELSRRLAERHRSSVVGVDTSPYAIQEAERRLAASEARERMELRLADVHDLDPDGTFDVVVCIGPGWTAGGWRSLAEWSARFVRRGGLLILGEGSWRTLPSDETLGRLGMAPDDYVRTDEVDDAVRSGDAEPLWSHRASRVEWDAYAEGYRSALEQFARAHPDDPIAPAAVERAGPGWAQFELLHEVLDFTVLIGETARIGQSTTTEAL